MIPIWPCSLSLRLRGCSLRQSWAPALGGWAIGAGSISFLWSDLVVDDHVNPRFLYIFLLILMKKTGWCSFFGRGSLNIMVMSAASPQDVMDYLSQDGHQITLLAAHDNMMTAFLVALDVFKDWSSTKKTIFGCNWKWGSNRLSHQITIFVFPNDDASGFRGSIVSTANWSGFNRLLAFFEHHFLAVFIRSMLHPKVNNSH